VVTTLAEALRADKNREALGYMGQQIIAKVEDDGVTFLNPARGPCDVTKSWASIVPLEQRLLDSLDWRPVTPKPVLLQLAEVIDDWLELA